LNLSGFFYFGVPYRTWGLLENTEGVWTRQYRELAYYRARPVLRGHRALVMVDGLYWVWLWILPRKWYPRQNKMHLLLILKSRMRKICNLIIIPLML